MGKKTYKQKKEEARKKAIKWQIEEESMDYSMKQYAEYSKYFRKLGKRYGLTKEFEENAII